MAKLEENYLNVVRQNLYTARSIQTATKGPTTVNASNQMKNNHMAALKAHAKKNGHPVNAPEVLSCDGLDKIPPNAPEKAHTCCGHQGNYERAKNKLNEL